MYAAKIFRCANCDRVKQNGIYKCLNLEVHVCNDCHPVIDQCLSCRTTQRNRNQSPVLCPNLFYGCKKRFDNTDAVNEHATTCPYQSFQCPCKCSRTVSFADLADHLNMQNFWSQWTWLLYEAQNRPDNDRESSYLLRTNDYLFVLRIRSFEKIGPSLLLNVSCCYLNNVRGRNLSVERLRSFVCSVYCPEGRTFSDKKLTINHIETNRDEFKEFLLELYFNRAISHVFFLILGA